MASRKRLRGANRFIADAFYDAKKREPGLTQREFARRTFPAELDPKTGERRAWPERKASRQLGRILAGKDEQTARRLVDESYNVRVANVEFTDARGNVVGFSNVLLPPGTSSFDAYKMANSKQAKQLARRLARGRLITSAPRNVQPREGSPRVSAVRPVKVNTDPRYVGTIENIEPEPTVSRLARRIEHAVETATERALDPGIDDFIDTLLG